MIIEQAIVEEIKNEKENIFLLKVKAPQIAANCIPGQFCNIKVSGLTAPLLRRPFSICDVEEDSLYFLFEVFGEGTRLISEKQVGAELNIMGPLGNGFDFEGDYDTAVIVGGGLGVAPFPFLTWAIPDDKERITFLGSKTSETVVTWGLENVFISTDDGSLGLKGNVLDLIKKNEKLFEGKKIKIFACGPNPMLKALQEYSLEKGIDCQLSTECAMACGFGICQGCAVESKTDDEKYKLVCIDGPVFDAKEIKL